MNKFDRILWRINGIFLLALLLFGLIPIWWNAIGLVRRPPSPPKQTALTRETIGSREKEDLYFDGLSRLTGTSIARMPLRSVSLHTALRLRAAIPRNNFAIFFISITPISRPGGCSMDLVRLS
jgi:hypothetical protein